MSAGVGADDERKRREALKLAGDVRRPLKASHKPVAKTALTSETLKALTKKSNDTVLDLSKLALDSDSFLTLVPDSVAELDLSENNLSRFISARHLTRLRVLLLESNALTDVVLGGLTRLETLSLSHNRLEALPECRDLAAKLQLLDLSHNTRLTRGFAELEQLKALRTLDLSHCGLEFSVRDLDSLLLGHLRALSKLTSLNLLGNPFVKAIPLCHLFVLQRLSQLKVVNLESVTKEMLKLSDQEQAKGTWDQANASSSSTIQGKHSSPLQKPNSGASRVNALNKDKEKERRGKDAPVQPLTPIPAKPPTVEGADSNASIEDLLNNLDAELDRDLMDDIDALLTQPSKIDTSVGSDKGTSNVSAADVDAALAELLSPRTALLLARAETREGDDSDVSDVALEDAIAGFTPAKKPSAPSIQTKSELETKLLVVFEVRAAVALFEDFLAKEHSQENLRYWIAVRDFKEKASRESWTPARISSEAKGIATRFLDAEADEWVNLDARLRDSALVAAQAPTVDITAFDASAAAALKLMAFDSFSRFLGTSEGGRCWQIASQAKSDTTPQSPSSLSPILTSLNSSAAPSSPSQSKLAGTLPDFSLRRPSPPPAPVLSASSLGLPSWQYLPTQLLDTRVLSQDTHGELSTATLYRPEAPAQRVFVRTIVVPPLSAATQIPNGIRSLLQIPHSPLLARFVGAVLHSSTTIALLYENVEGFSVRALLKDASSVALNAKQFLSIVRDTATALHTLHSHGVTHASLTARSVIVTASLHACLTDYGHALFMDQTVSIPACEAVDMVYMPPSIAWGSSTDPGRDVYALGVLLHALLAGREPDSVASLALLSEPVVPARLSIACTAQGAQLVQVLRVLAQRDEILVPVGWTQPKGLPLLPPRPPLPVRAISTVAGIVMSVDGERDNSDEVQKLRAVLDKVAELLSSPIPALQLKALTSLRAMAVDPIRAARIGENAALLRGLTQILGLAGQVGKFDLVEQALLTAQELAVVPRIAQSWPSYGILSTLCQVLCSVDDAGTQRGAGSTLASLVNAHKDNAALLRTASVIAALARLLSSGRPSLEIAACSVLATLLDDRGAQDSFLGEGGWQPLQRAVMGNNAELRSHALAVLAHFHSHALVAGSWPSLQIPLGALAYSTNPQVSVRAPALRALRSLPLFIWTDTQRPLLVRNALSALLEKDSSVSLAGSLLLLHFSDSSPFVSEILGVVSLTQLLESLGQAQSHALQSQALVTIATRLAVLEGSSPVQIENAVGLKSINAIISSIANPMPAARAQSMALLSRVLSTPERCAHVAETKLCDLVAAILFEESDALTTTFTCSLLTQLLAVPAVWDELLTSNAIGALLHVLDSPARATDRLLIAALQSLLTAVRSGDTDSRFLQALLEASSVRVLLGVLSRAQMEREPVRVQLAVLQSLTAIARDPYSVSLFSPMRTELVPVHGLLSSPVDAVQLEAIGLLSALSETPPLIPLLRSLDPNFIRLKALSVSPPPTSPAVTAKAQELLRILK